MVPVSRISAVFPSKELESSNKKSPPDTSRRRCFRICRCCLQASCHELWPVQQSDGWSISWALDSFSRSSTPWFFWLSCWMAYTTKPIEATMHINPILQLQYPIFPKIYSRSVLWWCTFWYQNWFNIENHMGISMDTVISLWAWCAASLSAHLWQKQQSPHLSWTIGTI